MLKKLKNFCRLTRHSEGFTLVELVVVIAIVAILSGIAVPAYGAYVEKSQKAGDLQLLAAVNKAFAAAVFENGDGIDNVQFAELLTSNDMQKARSSSGNDGAYTIVGIKSVTLKNGTANIDDYHESFRKYYADNLQSEFKAIKKLYFKEGVFEEDEELKLPFGDGEITIYESDAEKLGLSTFITAEGLGTDGLLNKVGEITDFASALLNSSDPSDGAAQLFQSLVSSAEYQKSLASYLGIPSDTEDLEAAIAEKLGISEDDPDAAEKASAVWTNGAVLYAAENVEKMTNAEIMSLLQSGNPKADILGAISPSDGSEGDLGKGLTQATLVYGMYTAYAYQSNDEKLIASTADPVSVLNGLGNAETNAGFQAYLKTPQAAADLEGYISALNMINSGSSDSNAAKDVLLNGFATEDLKGLLGDALK